MKDSEILEILNRLKTQDDKRLSELVMNLINETQVLKQEAYQDNHIENMLYSLFRLLL